jgi:hypothetical protein
MKGTGEIREKRSEAKMRRNKEDRLELGSRI